MIAELNGFWFVTLVLPGSEMHTGEELSADRNGRVKMSTGSTSAPLTSPAWLIK